MIPRTPRKTRTHRDWLELVDREGPFIAIPALRRVYPQGVPQLGENEKAALRDAKPDFDRAWDAWNRQAAKGQVDEKAVEQVRGARDKWIDAVLRDVARWDVHLAWGEDAFRGTTPTANSPSRSVTVEATGAFVRSDAVHAVVLVVDPVASLRDPLTDQPWTASPIDRMDAILRSSGHKVGVVTDGRWWGLVSTQDGIMTASGVVDSQTWIEEADVRDAFLELLSPIRLAGGKEADRLPGLFRESVTAAEDITVALGTQVRRAVELLVTALAEAAVDARGAGRPDPLPGDRGLVYEGAVTAMMRVVFLLFAEERSMLPQSALFTEGYGVSGLLDTLDKRARDEGAEALDATHYTWHRLLATSQALYEGVTSEDMRLPAYGGSLFDPLRFPFLTAVDDRGGLAVSIPDRVMLEVLRAVQYATIGAEQHRVSFRDVDVEQIGYIYEGLLGYTAEDVHEVTVGLLGTQGQEPEIPLSKLEDLYEAAGEDAKFVTALLAWIKTDQPSAKSKSAAALKKALASGDQLEDADRSLLTVTRDDTLLTRLRPYVGLIRRDLRDRPVVLLPGGLAVAETPSRANSGAHYTPKSLAQEVVRYALEPLVYQPGPHQTVDEAQWKLRSSNDLLDLKVADIACGSGAFLVAAAEYLAARVLEAWQAEGERGSAHALEVKAKRQVVAKCLYGADINGMAVEMCKLSLWLVSLDPDLPFSFVDDKLLHGNSLLGITDVRQIETLHIDPSKAKTFTGASDREKAYSTTALFGSGSEAQGIEMLDVRAVIQKAARLRIELASPVDENDPARSTNTKRRLWAQYQHLTAQLRDVADGVIAAGLQEGGKPGKKLNDRYDDLRIAVDAAFHADGTGNRETLDSIIKHGLTPTVETDYERWQPLHWALAVPDVMERGGFDAVIGNPPFLGGQKLTGAMGTNVRDWFVNVLAEGRRGSADLVAYFFLRATSLLSANGTLGLIATNTIAQGDTRAVGLDAMVAGGFTLTRAIQSRSWPAESANLEFSAVWGTRGRVASDVKKISDGVAVARISPLLEPAGAIDWTPVPLAENKGIAFQGCNVLGLGFTIDPAEAADWINADPSNRDVVFPYLGGTDLYGSPTATASRWVIDFNDRSEEQSSRYTLPFQRAVAKVKPERSRNNRRQRREIWWQFAERAPGLRSSIAHLDHVLALVQTSKTQLPIRVPTGQVFSHKLVVFATDDYGHQALLSSSLHQLWAQRFGSTLETRPVYTPSDVFETYPMPQETPGSTTWVNS
ncbi:Eco57I restriction-modification methylase domain-containing protein [Xylanimonas allomyrinae]|uniref:Eco57I restriction-modification methylase domain-containing protein n=1 Tax=Xylanimonas allomyrinae TaxID=2509459 RepID=UPI001FE88ED0|nr:DNA methyltransferase [Xylanimonas allomyrinae]